MKLFLDQKAMQYKSQIQELVDHEILFNLDFNGVEYTVEPSEYTYIEWKDETNGTILLSSIFSLIERLEHGEFED